MTLAPLISLPILAAIAAFLLIASLIPRKSTLERTVQAMESSNIASVADQSDFTKSNLGRAVSLVMSPTQADALSRRLIEAGWYTVTPAQFIVRVIASSIGGAVIAVLMARYLLHASVDLKVALPLIICTALVVAYLPIMWLTRAVEHRKDEVQRALPDFLDMVASTVNAGLSLNSALAYSVDAAPGALGAEVSEALSEIRLGRSRAEALKAMSDRIKQEEVTTTISAINQAEKVGANIGEILMEVADDTRTHHVLLVEEHAAKIPIMMAIPMGLFLIPALLITIFGALAANYFAHSVG